MKIFVAFLLLSLSSCVGVGGYLANVTVDESDLEITKDVSYNEKIMQSLDVYKSKNNHNIISPVIIFYYGGGYTEGSKDQYKFIAAHFAKQGYVVVIPDYRKYPQVKFPEFVYDSAHAYAWVKTNIWFYGGDARNIIVMGHSAGAHIASLMVYDEKYLESVGIDNKKIKAFIGFAGPYSFTPYEQLYKDIFDGVYYNMKADYFPDSDEPQALLIHGADDKIVHTRNLQLLADRIKKKNGKVQTRIFEGEDHISVISAYTKLAYNKEIVDYVQQYLDSLK